MNDESNNGLFFPHDLFILDIPLPQMDSLAVASELQTELGVEAIAHRGGGALMPMTILIVDDDELSLYLLQDLLSDNGYQVVTASQGAEALIRKLEAKMQQLEQANREQQRAEVANQLRCSTRLDPDR